MPSPALLLNREGRQDRSTPNEKSQYMDTTTQAIRSLERAVCRMLSPHNGQPFFAHLAMELQRKPDPKIPTAATDGRYLYFNPDYVNSLKPELVQSLVLHEILHVSNGHCWRKGTREHKRWNIACDYFVNLLIRDQCNGEIDKQWLIDDKWKGLAAEEIYAQLPEPKGQGDNGETGPGEVIDAEQSGHDGKVLEKEWQQKLVNAAAAVARGNVPSQFAHIIDEILNPKVPWQMLLQRFVQSIARTDYSWSRPNRKYSWQGFTLPSLYSQRVGHIAFAVDTSGSTHEYWNQFLDEAQAVLDQVQPEKLSYFEADCAIGKRAIYHPGDRLERQVSGGGGSATEPVFDALLADDDMPLCCVYLTDGVISYPDIEPPFPVLWVICNDQMTPPFGDVARI